MKRKKHKYVKMRAVLLNGLLSVLLVSGFVSGSSSLQAQSFSEWFKQKKTRKKYLLAQIAALGTYVKAVEQGYDIAQDGLTAVCGLKGGNFMQHALHFQSLQMVSPRVKGYLKVAAIPEMEDQMAQCRQSVLTDKNVTGYLNERELVAVRQLFNEASIASKPALEELEMLSTDHTLAMTDDERITQVDQLYAAVKNRVNHTYRVCRLIRAVAAARRTDHRDMTARLSDLYGL